MVYLSGLPNPEKIIEENAKRKNLDAQMQALQQENEMLKQQLGAAGAPLAPGQPGPPAPPQGG